jgi:hypothetical protein
MRALERVAVLTLTLQNSFEGSSNSALGVLSIASQSQRGTPSHRRNFIMDVILQFIIVPSRHSSFRRERDLSIPLIVEYFGFHRRGVLL